MNEDEAARVQAIIGLYLEYGSLMPVVQELDRRGWRMKQWTTRKGTLAGGQRSSCARATLMWKAWCSRWRIGHKSSGFLKGNETNGRTDPLADRAGHRAGVSGGGLGLLHNIHFVSCVQNAGEHHEFKGLNTHVRFESKTSPLEMVYDKIKAPTGSGFGVDFDPEWVAKHQNVRL